MYRIFIIGAGFSKLAGLPLGNELWKLVLNEAHLEKNFYDLLEPDILSYLEYQQKVYGRKTNLENIEIEDFISYLDIEHFLNLRGKDTFSEEGNKGQIILKVLIAKTIFQIQKNIPDRILKLYDKFCSSLHETDIIISFNYDTIIENSLTRISKPFRLFPHRFKSIDEGGGIIDSDIKEVVLLKMHGSINWFDKTCYNMICDMYKRREIPNPHVVRGNIFSNASLLNMYKILKGPFFKDSPLQNVYVSNHLDEYFNTQILLLNPPLIISPSFSKMVYLNPIKSFWDSFYQAGVFNRSLTVIGFSFPRHDRYLMQVVVKIILNFQKHNQFNNFYKEKKYKKHKLIVVDLQKDEQAKEAFQNKLQFIDWNASIFLTNGFNNSSISKIFDSENSI